MREVNDCRPLVSIITIVYNGEEFLNQAMVSVLEQTYSNIEYIVIDGGSSDRSVEIIKKYENSLSYWVSEKDRGIYNAWNKGLAKANGELIGFLNADDWYQRDAVEKAVKHYLNSKEQFVYFGCMALRTKSGDYLYKKSSSFTNLTRRMSVSHPTVFISKDIYVERQFNESYRICGDYEFFLFLFKKARLNIICDESIVTNMRIGGVSDDFKSTIRVIIEDHRARLTHLSTGTAYKSFLKDLFIKLPKKVTKNILTQFGVEKLLNEYYSKKKF